MGHMFEHTESDILIRWRRMCGDRVLWMPGTDHAGIATQMLVERQLASEGTTRQKMGREAFVERVWEWRRHYGGAILDPDEAAWAPPSTGSASTSPWMRGSRWRCARRLFGFTSRD